MSNVEGHLDHLGEQTDTQIYVRKTSCLGSKVQAMQHVETDASRLWSTNFVHLLAVPISVIDWFMWPLMLMPVPSYL